MTVKINHAKVSGKTQGTDATRVYGNHWDADHTVMGAAALAGGNAFTGDQSIAGTVTINPTAGTLGQGFSITQAGPLVGPVPGPQQINYNTIAIQDQTASAGIGWNTNGLFVIMSTGSANAYGSKVAGQFLLNHFLESNTDGDDIALYAKAQSNAKNGGTALVPDGTLFSGSFESNLTDGALYYYNVSGPEIGVGIAVGASSLNRIGLTIGAKGALQADVGGLDMGLEIAGNTTSFRTGIAFTRRAGGQPVSTTGTLIGVPDGLNFTALSAMDFSPLTLTYLLKGPNGFSIDGSGNIAAKSLTLATGGPGVGISLADGTVIGAIQPNTLFGHSLLVGTSTAHNLYFAVGNVPVAYFDTNFTMNLGLSGSSRAVLNFNGFTSGTLKLTVPDVAGTPTVTFGTSSGTPVVATGTNDTNIGLSLATATGILTPSWIGTLAAARLNANVVQSAVNDTNVTASISAQALTLGWTGTLAATRGGFGADISAQSGVPLFTTGTATFTGTSGTGNFARVTNPAFVTPDLGTPSAAVLTNATGTASGLTAGHVTTNANLTGPITSVGNATSIASQTGTGTKFVVDTSPTLVTPNLGTPSAAVLTNATGLPTTALTGALQAAQEPAHTGDVTNTAGSLALTLTTAQPAVHTWALAQTFTVAPVFTDQSGSRTALGLGTAATQNTGTSGGNIPLLNGTNTWSGVNTYSTNIHYQVVGGTGSGFWLDSVTTGADRWFFGSDASAADTFRIFSTLAAGNVFTYTANATSANGIMSIAGLVTATGGIVSTSSSGGVGYATGAGGAVTQATSRTTGVTLNKVSGAITLVSAAGSATPAQFTVTNSAVVATDVIIINQKSGTDKYNVSITAVAAGSFQVNFSTTGGTTTEQPVFNFSVIKGVVS